MAQTTNLNVAPYYDDYDETFNFHKVLFRPGFSIQARELTSLQSILQNQIERFGNHMFKEGAVVIPGQVSYSDSYYSVKLSPTFADESINLEQYVDYEKDIGVAIDNKLNFDKDICEKVNKANFVMGLIRRSFSNLDEHSFKILFTSVVRPHLEYANQIWSPLLCKHIDMIENVQRRATKMIPRYSDLSYEMRLRKLNLPTLSYRRLRGDVIEAYKILTGKYDNDVSNFIPLRRDSFTRGHHLKIYKSRPRLNIRKNTFAYRVADVWNNLPSDVINSKNLQIFERKLDICWKNQPIRFDYKADFLTCALNYDNVENQSEELML